MGHTGVLDGAVDVEAVAEAEEALVTTAVDEAAAEGETCPVAVDPVARIAAGVVRPLRIPILCASRCPPKTVRNLPKIPPPAVPGVAAPFPPGSRDYHSQLQYQCHFPHQRSCPC